MNNLIPEPSDKMLAFLSVVRARVEAVEREYIEMIERGCANHAETRAEKEAFRRIHDALSSEEDINALKKIIRLITIGCVGSAVLDVIDEGIRIGGTPPNAEYLHLDLIDRETGESIITWSAQEEFWDIMPDDFLPFPYDPSDQE